MNPTNAVPVVLFAIAAIVLLLRGGRNRVLLAALVTSYCGVIAVTFTGGASGGIWLVQVLVLAVAPLALTWRPAPPFGSAAVTRLTYLMFAVYLYAIAVGIGRYDESLEHAKAGSFTAVAGIPLSVLITGYRLVVLAGLVLAFTLPMRCAVGPSTLRRCLVAGWLMSVVLALAGVLDYLGVADLAFSYRREAGYAHVAILGFHRAALGMMTVYGIYLTFAMTQLTPSPVIRRLGYATVPLLLAALVFSWSRAAIGALAVSAVVLAILLGGVRAAKSSVLWGIGAAAVVWALLLQYPEISDRLFASGSGYVDTSGEARVEAWRALSAWLLDRPEVLLLGVGFQNFNYLVNVKEGAVWLEAAHNGYLHTLTETGLVGFAVLLIWQASVIAWVMRWRRRDRRRETRILTAAFLALTTAALSSSLTQETLAPGGSMVPLLLHYYLLLGLWISAYRAELAAVPSQGAARPRASWRRAWEPTREPA
jgi:O-antigen ligase